MILPVLLGACDALPLGPVDLDGDGHTASIDCDDANAAVHPGATETCDGIDQDCDGSIDEGATDAILLFVDEDGDGFGTREASRMACPGTDGLSEVDGDCDDGRADVHPEGVEVCDDLDVDEDCDGVADDMDDDAEGAVLVYRDRDGDGFGDPDSEARVCDPGDDAVDNAEDCDDQDPRQNPELGCASAHDGPWTGTLAMATVIFGSEVRCYEPLDVDLEAGAVPALAVDGEAPCASMGVLGIEGRFDGPDAMVLSIETTAGTTELAATLEDDTLRAYGFVDTILAGFTVSPELWIEVEPDR